MKNNPLLKALCALLALASSALAQVNYVRDIDLPESFSSHPIISTSQSPITGGETYLVPDAFSELEYAALDVSAGTFGLPVTYPGLAVTTFTVFAWVGHSSTGVKSISVTRGIISVYSLDDMHIESTVHLNLPATFNYSLAARSLESPISFITDVNGGSTGHYTVDPATGVATAMPLSGVDAATTRFMSYGVDGLLYVLDYGNNRIASFDPDNAFAPVSSFTLETGVTVANEQFAIGATGSFYLADGLGGGSYYNSLGQYQGVFTLPENAVLNPYTGASFINTDAQGNILVYDSATGLHQYQDSSVVPEPGTVALIGFGALALLFRRRAIRPS